MCAGVFSAQYAHAQTNPLILSLDHVPIAPGDVVRVDVRSFSMDLQGVTLQWWEDGALKAQGVGLLTHTTTLGDVGDERSVYVRAVGSADETLAEDILIITPASVDIIWESSSYTHPFYYGRKLPSAGARVHAEARPQFIDREGNVIPRENLHFEWRLNEKILPEFLGKGDYQVYFSPLSPFGDNSLSVVVSSPENGINASMKVRIPSTVPQLTLYAADPLLGIDFSHAIPREYVVPDLETTFVLIPQFAAIQNLRDAAAHIVWKVNGTEAPPHTDDQTRITFVAEDGGIETALQSLFSVENNTLQEGKNAWKITFDVVSGAALDLFLPATTP